MSFDALSWAAKQDTGSSGTKLVLLGLAECADRSHGLAFPSLAALAEFSCLDRKSIIANLDKLEAAGFIQDTGRKVGQTKQIKVYQLLIESIPKTEPSQKRNSSEISVNSPKNGTRNKSEPVISEAKASLIRIFNHFNDVAGKCGLHRANTLNHSRTQMGLARLKEHGEEKMIEAIDICGRSPFCRGEVGDGRRADIMMILQPRTLDRLLEGFYGQDEIKREVDPAAFRAQQIRTAALYDRLGRTNEAEEIRRLLEMPADPSMAANVVRLVREVGSGAAKNFGGAAAR